MAIGSMMAASSTQAALIVDLRATEASGSLTLDNSKQLTYAGSGTGTATIEVWAVATGAAGNAGLEGFQSAFGSYRSSNSPIAATDGTVRGTLGAVLPASFNEGSGPTAGDNNDLDGDLDQDVGGLLNTSSTGWFFARSTEIITTANAAAQSVTFNALADGGIEVLIGTVTFNNLSSPAGVDGDDVTQINWVGRVDTPTFTAFQWQQDGAAISAATNSSIAGGTPISVVVPEPASLSLLGLAAMGVLRRRRA